MNGTYSSDPYQFIVLCPWLWIKFRKSCEEKGQRIKERPVNWIRSAAKVDLHLWAHWYLHTWVCRQEPVSFLQPPSDWSHLTITNCAAIDHDNLLKVRGESHTNSWFLHRFKNKLRLETSQDNEGTFLWTFWERNRLPSLMPWKKIGRYSALNGG